MKMKIFTQRAQGNFIDWHVKISQISHIPSWPLGSSAVSLGWSSVNWPPQWAEEGEPRPAVQVSASLVLLCCKRTKSSAQFPASCTQHISMHSLPSSASSGSRSVSRHWHSTEGAGTCCSVTPQFSKAPCPILAAGWDGSVPSPVSWSTPACSSPSQPTWHCSCQDGNKAKHALSHAHSACLTTFLKTKFWIRRIYRRSKPLARETWKCGAFRRA